MFGRLKDWARLGGDEFAEIVPNLAGPAYASDTAQAILSAINITDDKLPATATVGVSIGIAVFPADGADRTTLLSRADTALYEAKATGRGTYRFFDASMSVDQSNRRQLENDLYHAIFRNELSLAYQPQAELQSDKIFGFEALLRWDHGMKGRISPEVFIPIAEECGAIHKIGEWVLRAACTEAARWEKPLTISVNVSAMQLHHGSLPELIEEVLRETGLEPARLELEVTESCMIIDIERALVVLNELRNLGLKIAMDDFGTGYSSLASLRAFPFDKIKIDKSLVRSVDTCPEAAAILRAVLGLARGLKIPVLAEGVETGAELNFLRGVSCDAIQGYLLSRPAPIADFAQHTNRAHPADLRRQDEQELRPAQPALARVG